MYAYAPRTEWATRLVAVNAGDEKRILGRLSQADIARHELRT